MGDQPGQGQDGEPGAGPQGERGQALADEPQWEASYDVIVCGAGAAGLAAAITIDMEGDGASVLLLEKAEVPGGNSPFCAGNSLATDDAEEMKGYLRKLIGEATPEDVIDAYAEGLLGTWDWFVKAGGELPVGIESLPAMDEAKSSMFNVQSSMIYNLAGQQLSKPQHGVNIINGKKVVVK